MRYLENDGKNQKEIIQNFVICHI